MRCVLFLMLFPVSALAQTLQPQITAEAPTEPVIVGQPAIVRIKVLVPTFMPSPPEFPALEQENLLVRLPERASGPVSETIDGETWSGVQRSYRLYPLQAGNIDFGAQEVAVTFADPDTNAPVQVSVPLPAMTLSATVPEAARDLNPLILATGFEIDQRIEGEADMQSGDAITRQLTARISGTTPLLVPELIPDLTDPLLRAYPKEPRFTETDDRGVLSGQRVDEVVYLAQDGGQAQLPPLTVQWYNLETNHVETIQIDGVNLTLAPPKWEPPDLRTILTALIWLVGLTLALWAMARYARPHVRSWQMARRNKFLASPEYAQGQLETALQARDLNAAHSALDLWKSRYGPSATAELEHCLTRIGAARYSPQITPATDWDAALSMTRSLRRSRHRSPDPLPPLNP